MNVSSKSCMIRISLYKKTWFKILMYWQNKIDLLKTSNDWLSSAIVCSVVGLLSLWHIPHFHSQFYYICVDDYVCLTYSDKYFIRLKTWTDCTGSELMIHLGTDKPPATVSEADLGGGGGPAPPFLGKNLVAYIGNHWSVTGAGPLLGQSVGPHLWKFLDPPLGIDPDCVLSFSYCIQMSHFDARAVIFKRNLTNQSYSLRIVFKDTCVWQNTFG